MCDNQPIVGGYVLRSVTDNPELHIIRVCVSKPSVESVKEYGSNEGRER